MKFTPLGITLVLVSSAALCTQAAVFFVSPAGQSVPPYASWSDAATSIQDAIDAASAGDVVWVTNGFYATGGKVMTGDLTNRVALDKAVTVQSVNGPLVTMIQGAWDPATNGPVAIRCAWLTNGALLQGFTLQGGATRTVGTGVMNGGGVFCTSSGATVANCLIISNAAGSGGAAYQGTLDNCLIMGNRGSPGISVGGAFFCALRNCTVVSNSTYGTSQGTATNCIIFANGTANYSSGTFSYCCTTPPPAGAGNINTAPGLAADGFHLTAASPCIAAGTNLTVGSDIDGTPWSNPPPIGCDQWQASPVVDPPVLQLTWVPVGFNLRVFAEGQDPLVYQWYQNGSPMQDDAHFNGAHSPVLAANGVNGSDAGAYQVVVSNAVGVVTSAVAQVVIHYADAAGSNPQAPFESWSSAATNIQDAIDAALPGELVLVTNGTYAAGGKIKGGDLTNRVALDKPVLVQSLSGPGVTTIQGVWDPVMGTGPLAVRAAWLTHGAILSGFTITAGSTRAASSPATTEEQGGGVFGYADSLVSNCMILTNTAGFNGGGAYGLSLQNCTLTGNTCSTSAGGSGGGGAANCNLNDCVLNGNYAYSAGGGAHFSKLKNCAVLKNSSALGGGGVQSGSLINCTLTGNTVGSSGSAGGAFLAQLTNCIIYGNKNITIQTTSSNYSSCTMSYCCSGPLPSGAGNISADPQLLSDGIHLMPTSPCRGAGTAAGGSGTDIDGQPWANPPDIGCDEWQPAPVIISSIGPQVFGRPLSLKLGDALAAGQAPFSFGWLKDGAAVLNGPHYGPTDSPSLVISNFGPADAGAYQVVASNAFGMATSLVAQVTVHCVDASSSGPVPPYSNWSTAAATIQDAIDAASPTEFVLVTNGVYSTGGRVMAGDLTNRIVLSKGAVVAGINGAAATVIQGAWDPVSTNGPLAARCVWLADGAVLAGFTVTGGATRTNGDNTSLQSGGGVWATSTNATVTDCIISNNLASYGGGGTYQAQLNRCMVAANRSSNNGGGSYQSRLANSFVFLNRASVSGAGAWGGTLFNCTVTDNFCPGPGGGIYNSSARNCIVVGNGFGSSDWYGAGFGQPDIAYTCTTPLPPSGLGNITSDPQLLDGLHLGSTSPCIGAGSVLYSSSTDIDGEPWLNPPSIGCDEFYLADCIGRLSVTLHSLWPAIAEGARLTLFGGISGRASSVSWSFGDGTPLVGGGLNKAYTWTNPGDYTVIFTAYNLANPGGVSTNLLIHVLPRVPPTLTIGTSTGGAFALSCPTLPGPLYTVQQTTNLIPPVTWQTIGQALGTGDPVLATDPGATNGTRFFRVYFH